MNDYREFYGKNETLHRFSKNCIHLQKFILWGPDERDKEIWNQPETIILADRFEMLVGVIYLEGGIDAVKIFLNKHKFFQEIERFEK